MVPKVTIISEDTDLCNSCMTPCRNGSACVLNSHDRTIQHYHCVLADTLNKAGLRANLAIIPDESTRKAIWSGLMQRMQGMYEWPSTSDMTSSPSGDIPLPGTSSATSTSDCRSCQKVSDPSFYSSSTVPADIEMQCQGLHALINEEDGLFRDFAAISDKDKKRVTRIVLQAIADELVCFNPSLRYPYRSIAVCAGTLILRQGYFFGARWTDDSAGTLDSIKQNLKGPASRSYITQLISGLVKVDASAFSQHPPNLAQPAGHIILSTTWLLDKWRELVAMGTEMGFSSQNVGDAASTATLWAAIAVFKVMDNMPPPALKVPEKPKEASKSKGKDREPRQITKKTNHEDSTSTVKTKKVAKKASDGQPTGRSSKVRDTTNIDKGSVIREETTDTIMMTDKVSLARSQQATPDGPLPIPADEQQTEDPNHIMVDGVVYCRPDAESQLSEEFRNMVGLSPLRAIPLTASPRRNKTSLSSRKRSAAEVSLTRSPAPKKISKVDESLVIDNTQTFPEGMIESTTFGCYLKPHELNSLKAYLVLNEDKRQSVEEELQKLGILVSGTSAGSTSNVSNEVVYATLKKCSFVFTPLHDRELREAYTTSKEILFASTLNKPVVGLTWLSECQEKGKVADPANTSGGGVFQPARGRGRNALFGRGSVPPDFIFYNKAMEILRSEDTRWISILELAGGSRGRQAAPYKLHVVYDLSQDEDLQRKGGVGAGDQKITWSQYKRSFAEEDIMQFISRNQRPIGKNEGRK